MKKRERFQYSNNPRYASGTDFKNPFYVVVHAGTIDVEIDSGYLPKDIGLKVKAEIKEIKSKHPNSWTKAEPCVVAKSVPSDRPILVCGAFEEICVLKQYRELPKAGYDAYISREGILPYSSLN